MTRLLQTFTLRVLRLKQKALPSNPLDTPALTGLQPRAATHNSKEEPLT